MKKFFAAFTLLFVALFLAGCASRVLAPVPARASELAPHLKVLICAGDYGMWAQDRVPLIENAVEKSAPNAKVSWQAQQSFNFTQLLQSPGNAEQFDVIVMGDISLGQLTPRAQENLVRFVQNGGGLIYVMAGKSTIPFKGSEDAVPMPLKTILPVAYPNFNQPAPGSSTLAATDALWNGVDFSNLKDEAARKSLDRFLIERPAGKGKVLALYGAFGPNWKMTGYAKFEKISGGWDAFPQLGEVWARVLQRAAQSSPVRNQSRESLDAKIQNAPLEVAIDVDATKTIDEIRAADFSVVALQQLYNEDGGAGEELFLALNPRDWFDRRTAEVLPNTKGVKADKPAFFREFNIKGIWMGDNSFGSYSNWNDKKYQEQIDKAIADKKRWPQALQWFQPGNEPPLDENYLKFHNRFVNGVLAQAPGYQVIGPNKAFNLSGVDPKEMQFYLDKCGQTTDVLNWHTYAQPPSTTLAEARYWSDRATGKMRAPGPAKVMFTESDAWNQGDSQFNYLMTRAFTFLPEKRIIANFQYCMRPRTEGGTYKFGVLQPEGEMSANYNGYWIWRNLRGQMVASTLRGANGQENIHAISSISSDRNTVTTVLYYDQGFFDGEKSKRADKTNIALQVKLPDGNWNLKRSDAAWNVREEKAVAGNFSGAVKMNIELAPYHAVALTWTKR